MHRKKNAPKGRDAVTCREIPDIVKTLKNKKSTDCFGIDMILV